MLYVHRCVPTYCWPGMKVVYKYYMSTLTILCYSEEHWRLLSELSLKDSLEDIATQFDSIYLHKVNAIY